jgi:hypothetical protein
MTRNGRVSGIALNVRRARASGTLSVSVQKSSDGGVSYAPMSGAQVMLDRPVNGAQATFAPAACPFSSGDILRLVVSSSAEWGPAANELDAVLEIET